MDVQISMETTFDDGTRRTHRLGDLSRHSRLTNSEALGLLLSDAKAIISQIQRAILTDQLEEVVAVNVPSRMITLILADWRFLWHARC